MSKFSQIFKKFFLYFLVFSTAVAGTILLFYPGCITGDSMYQWQQSKSGHLDDFHPPMMSFIWIILNRLPLKTIPEFSNMFVFTTVIYWLAIALISRYFSNSRKRFFACFIVLGFSPPAFGIVSQIIKDGFCAIMLYLTFALALASRHYGYRKSISLLLSLLSLITLLVSIGLRFNAVFAAFPISFICVYGLIDSIPNPKIQDFFKRSSRRIIASIFIFSLLVFSVLTFNKQVVESHRYPEQIVTLYDVVGISVRSKHNYLPSFYETGQNETSIENLKTLYGFSVSSIWWYEGGIKLRFVENESERDELRKSWYHAIKSEFPSYLSHRINAFSNLMLHNIDYNHPFQCMKGGGDTSSSIPILYESLKSTFIFQGWFYVTSIILFLIAIASYQELFSWELILLGASGLMYGCAYFFIAVDPHLRYLYWDIFVFSVMGLRVIPFMFDKLFSKMFRPKSQS